MENIDEFINTIELIKQSLLFYADTANYESIHKMNGELFSKIEMDNGNQARFAIKQIEDLNKYMEELQNFDDVKSFEYDGSDIEEFIKKAKKTFK